MMDKVLIALGFPVGIVGLFVGVAVVQNWTRSMNWALLVCGTVIIVCLSWMVVNFQRASHGRQVVDAPSRMIDLRDEGRWLDNRMKWGKLLDLEARQLPASGLPMAGVGSQPVAVNDRWLEDMK